jgi:hypothetical protein
MSRIEFKPCKFEEATHVEVNDKVYLLGGNEVELESYHNERIGIRWQEGDVFIPVDAFPIFGVQPLKEKKREPIEFIGYTKYYGQTAAHVIHVPAGVPLYATFRCVQILEEEKK